MPAKIRVRCKVLDCRHLDGLFCSMDDIELDPRKFCLTFAAVEVQEDDKDEEFEDEDLDEISWEDIDGEEEEDDTAYEDE